MRIEAHVVDSFTDDETLQFEQCKDGDVVRRVRVVLGREGAEMVAGHLRAILTARRERAENLARSLEKP